jgi:putative phage-type endonuclease
MNDTTVAMMEGQIEQRSPEWYAMRAGKVTASRISDMIARTKTGWGAGRKNYRAELVQERLTGIPIEGGYISGPMQWGIDTEPQARALYEFQFDVNVVQVPFISHPRIVMAGCSPDGFVGHEGIVEFKCPNTAQHLDTLLNETIPPEYVPQMQWQMACSGRLWVDWVSFDPRLPAQLQLFVKRCTRDDAQIDMLEEQTCIFLAEVEEIVDKLRARYKLQDAA